MGGEPSLNASPVGEQQVKDSLYGGESSVIRSTVFEHIICYSSYVMTHRRQRTDPAGVS